MTTLHNNVVATVADLQASGVPMHKVAKYLGISRASLYRRIDNPGSMTLDEYGRLTYLWLIAKSEGGL